jgi:signal transduction histidine kinase
MEGSVAQATMRDAAHRLPAAGVARVLRLYAWPLLGLLVGVPVTAAAVIESFSWLDATFPGFLLMDNAVVPSVSGLSWPRNKAQLFHSQVVAVDGTHVESNADVYRAVAARPVGTPIAYTIRKAGRDLRLTLRSMTFTLADYLQVYGILLMIAVTSLVVGVVVGFMQPRTLQARLYLFLSVIVCLWTSTAVFLHLPGFRPLTVVYFLAESFFPAALTHLAIHFPVERRFAGWQRIWPTLPYLISSALAALATYLYTAASFLFSLVAMAFAYWEDREPRARLRVKAIFPSFILVAAFIVFAFTNNAVSGGDFPMQLGVLLVPSIFISVAYAIAKHDLFDIDRFVRQSFVYGLLSLIVISAYAAVLMIPTRLAPSWTENQTLLGMAFVLVLAFALDPLRSVVQNLVDRAFYRTRLDYRATIRGLSQVMTSLLNLREVVSQVTHVVTEAMHLESTTLCLFDDDGRSSTLWSRGVHGESMQRATDVDVQALQRSLQRLPQEFDAQTLTERAVGPGGKILQSLLATTAAHAILQMVLGGRAIGLLLLGSKRSGHPFTSDDIDLLRTLANQTAIALQNARSYAALEQLTRDLDAKIRQQEQMFQLLQDREARLAEAVQDKDRLYQESLRYQRTLQQLSRRMMQVSERTMQRLAHELHDDLGQALTSVKMQLGLIERSLPPESTIRPSLSEARAQVGELLQSVRHLSQLLRPAVLDDLGLVPAMQSHVGRFSERTGIGVRLHCGSPDTRLPAPIEVALYRVLQEALTNIARHADARHVDVQLTIDAEAASLRIRDDGRGFDAATFFENPPSGHGMGVLGMRERVATYGGQFEIHSRPDEGTTVELSIPVAQPLPDSEHDYGEDSRLAG